MSDKKPVAASRDSSGKTNYHSGFLSGLDVLLWPYRDQITMIPEKVLSTEGIRMDILLLKKNPDLKIEFDIAKIFKEHNVIEYKRDRGSLNIDVFSKVLAYAYLYKSQTVSANAIPFDSLSATIYRHAYPRTVFKQLVSNGAVIEKAFPGVYYIRKTAPFSIQILVGKELDPDEYSMFRVLLPNACDDDIRRFKDIALRIHDEAYRKSVDNIFQVSVSHNQETYARLRKEEPGMCEALRELMKDEFDALDKKVQKAEEERDAATKERDAATKERDAATKERDAMSKKFDVVSEELANKNAYIKALETRLAAIGAM